MIPARLIKDLEKKGFSLEFPSYSSNEEEIIEILRQKNERLYAAIPILLIDKFDYDRIKTKLNKSQAMQLNRIILIAENIFAHEGISNNLKGIIKENNIRQKIIKGEIEYYKSIFAEAKERRISKEEGLHEKELEIRSVANESKAMSTIFSPGKIRIMGKIYSHEPLTNTELKYYYRSIRPYIHAMLNESFRKYVGIIESSKKYKVAE